VFGLNRGRPRLDTRPPSVEPLVALLIAVANPRASARQLSAVLALGAAVAVPASVLAHVSDTRPLPELTRSCNSRIESGQPRRQLVQPGDVGLGPIAFRRLARLGRDRRNLHRQANAWVLKSPVLVLSDRTVVVAVADRARGSASLFLDRGAYPPSVADGVAAVELHACARSVRARTHAGRLGVATEFGAAFLVDRPMCVPLEVWLEGRAVPWRRLVPVGVRACSARP
jgi:hypothetical protein